MKNTLRNIRARYRRLNNPTKELQTLFQNITKTSTKTDLNSFARSIKAFQQGQKLERKVKVALQIGVKRPAKTEKTLDKQIKQQRALNRRVDRFVDKQREYNKTVKLSKQRDILNLLPQTDKEIKKAYRILNKAKKGNVTGVEKLLRSSLPKTEEVKPIIQMSREMFGNKYKQYIYFRTSIEQAQESTLPEIAQLFREGGADLVEDLRRNDFTLFEYANSLTESASDGDIILAKLMIASRGLTARNKKLVEEFARKHI